MCLQKIRLNRLMKLSKQIGKLKQKLNKQDSEKNIRKLRILISKYRLLKEKIHFEINPK